MKVPRRTVPCGRERAENGKQRYHSSEGRPGLLAYLFYLSIWALFLFVFVPALYGGILYGLIQLGFPPGLVDVWGLAILGGTLVLLILRGLIWLQWRVRGSPPPSLPPEPPRWAKVLFTTGVWGAGLGAGVAVCFSVMLFLSLGAWPRLDAQGAVYLGELETVKVGSGHKASFVPRGRYWQNATRDLPLPEAELVSLEVTRVTLEGPLGDVLGKLGLGSCAFPWDLHQKVTAEAEGMKVAPLLEGRPDFTIEKILGALALLPGARVEQLRTDWEPLAGVARRGLEIRGGRLVLGTARAPDPDAPPRPTPTAPPTPDRPDPTDPDGDLDPDRRPVATTPPTNFPPLAELPADRRGVPLRLYPGDPRVEGSPGDPFEGLD